MGFNSVFKGLNLVIYMFVVRTRTADYNIHKRTQPHSCSIFGVNECSRSLRGGSGFPHTGTRFYPSRFQTTNHQNINIVVINDVSGSAMASAISTYSNSPSGDSGPSFILSR